MARRTVLQALVLLLLLLLAALVTESLADDPSCPETSGLPAMKRLKMKLFCHYDVHDRPVHNRTANVTVSASLELKRIHVVDTTNQNDIIAWVTVVWHDENLKWNASDYDNITQFEIPSNEIWTPDLAVYNSEASQSSLFMQTPCIVSHWGRVMCVPSLRSPVFCEQSLQNWPRDSRTCQLFLGSWSYTGSQLDLQLYYEGYTLFGYKRNYEWELSRVSVSKQVTVYPCCPTEPYVYLVYEMHLSRHAALYAASVIAPAFVLAGITLASFWARGMTSRCLVCVAALLGNARFLQFVGQILPADGDTSPTIVAYYRDAMVLSALALVVSLCVCRLEACSTPRWLEGLTVWVRGRGGKPGKLLLGEGEENEVESTSAECSAAATLLDRAFFITFTAVYAVLLAALLP